MKKYAFLIAILSILISSCEKDDFCTNPKATPKLVLRFFDKDANSDLKNVERLSVIAQGKTDSLFTNQTTDSIAIPLNTLTNLTVYTLKMNNTDETIANNKVSTLTIQYTPKEDFVSRSCGFRIIFKDVSINESGDWINNLSTTSITTIDNENNAHVKVFH
ncbi:DUF6452 family protein [uncultured Tenacibaculum sp.]|uniref:DUF6452 family protein n=1 Tax=uncultured Tenacibaculum sp. TaxID=174713 RepID=UPI00260DCB60|nr:DUF6452 family protein [uncultured Tenacibaculum sp.]